MNISLGHREETSPSFKRIAIYSYLSEGSHFEIAAQNSTESINHVLHQGKNGIINTVLNSTLAQISFKIKQD